MTLNLSSAVDLAASLSLILALGYLYAQIRRVLAFPRAGQVFLGIAFGLAAVSQMYRPFEPIDGLIIDLRAIPVALAGAFLGWRPALLAMMIAVLARLQIGGVGALAGILAIAIAGTCGILWNKWTLSEHRRGPLALLGLAFFMSLHLSAAIVLPEPSFSWFLSNAALPILVMNMFCLPVAAMILENERIKHTQVESLKSSVFVEPQSGLMTPEVFYRECAVRACSFNDTSFTRILVVRVRHHLWLDIWATARARQHLLRAMFLRLDQSDAKFPFAASVDRNLLLLPMSQDQILDLETLRTGVRRILAEEPYGFAGGAETRIEIDMRMIPLGDHDMFLAHVQNLSTRIGNEADATNAGTFGATEDEIPLSESDLSGSLAARRLSEAIPGNLDKLFERADLMMRKGT